MRILSIAFLILLLALAGCGGSTGTTGLFLNRRIIIADGGNDRLAAVDNISGSGWTTFGSNGNGVNQFADPTGLAFDSIGRIYIADWGNNRIVRMNDLSGSGWVAFGDSGGGVGQFNRPYKIAIDSTDRIYITDSENDRVVRINDMTGAGWVSFGTAGTGTGQFDTPVGIAVDSSFRVYIGDYFNSRLVRIDDMSGSNWTTFTNANLDSPLDIRLYGSKMLVNDRNGRVILTNLMSATGWQEITINTPQSSVQAPDGSIFTVDQNNDFLNRFDSITDGSPQTFAGPSGDELSNPNHVVIGPVGF